MTAAPSTAQTGSAAPQPLQRQGPSPLVLHMAMARWQYAGAQAALAACLDGKALPGLDTGALQRWADRAATIPKAQLSAALAEHCTQRLTQFLAGIERYQSDPFERAMPSRTLAAQCESAAALACGGSGGTPVVVIPSLINPSWVLDLLPGRSFVEALAQAGHRPFLIDWGTPGPRQTRYSLSDYITVQLVPLLTQLHHHHGPLHIIGYCLGGNLALAAALQAPELVKTVTAIAAPWDFAVMGDGARAVVRETQRQLQPVMARTGVMPAEALQAMFAQLDPTQIERKFNAFAQLDPQNETDRRRMDHFIAVEEWSNSGPPLAAGCAHDCLAGFYGENAAMRGTWRVNGAAVAPDALQVPAMVVTAQRDKIVPPGSTLALAAALPNAHVLNVDAGHVGMMVGSSARSQCWGPIANWLG